ncbi:hypothetical protein FH972_023936 [Carpinus fangiana]|uniref:Uncharacterized protein n=1 Tax=Carpinus fangiana TaxID=176857 RepID=A0A5N6KXE2_9ROSI|nr:hypothetical protein FH972_023936 [Carpinus fangiana]
MATFWVPLLTMPRSYSRSDMRGFWQYVSLRSGAGSETSTSPELGSAKHESSTTICCQKPRCKGQSADPSLGLSLEAQNSEVTPELDFLRCTAQGADPSLRLRLEAQISEATPRCLQYRKTEVAGSKVPILHFA